MGEKNILKFPYDFIPINDDEKAIFKGLYTGKFVFFFKFNQANYDVSRLTVFIKKNPFHTIFQVKLRCKKQLAGRRTLLDREKQDCNLSHNKTKRNEIV